MSLDKENIALNYLSKNKKLFIDMIETINNGRAEIVYAKDNGVLLYEKESLVYMLAANDEKSSEEISSHLDMNHIMASRALVVAHGKASRDGFMKNHKVFHSQPCYLVSYNKKELHKLNDLLDFKYPNEAETNTIIENYWLEPPESIRQLCKEQKIICGFKKETGELAGFIGEHPDGSMGLLRVFPEFRRCGYGEELEGKMLNIYLESNRVPFASVVTSNDASMHLQKKLGYDVADEEIYWLFLKDEDHGN